MDVNLRSGDDDDDLPARREDRPQCRERSNLLGVRGDVVEGESGKRQIEARAGQHPQVADTDLPVVPRPITAASLLELLAGLAREGQTVVMATHEREARRLASRSVTLVDGRVAAIERGGDA